MLVYTMKTKESKHWLKPKKRLSRGEQNKLREGSEGKASIEEVITLIEQSPENKPVCPHCKGTEFYRWGKASELQRYRCRQCNRTFNALTGTPRARLRHKDKWLEFEKTMIEGLSLRKSASICGIATNTSFKWRKRFLQIPATKQSDKINDIVEGDETKILQSSKKQRRLPRSSR